MTRIEVVLRVGDADLPAGILGAEQRRGRDAGAYFTYHPAYLADPRGYDLGPGLPRRAGTLRTPPGRLMFGAFTDCAPDRWGRTLMQRANRARAAEHRETARTLTELDFLLGARDDLRQGALRFRDAEGGPFLTQTEEGVPALAQLGDLLALADRAADEQLVAEDLARLVRGGSSLGGARPKAHVRSADGTAAIAKFPSAATDTWNVMAWEATALDLAARAGIDVPTHTLLEIAGRSVLVLDRFDRRGTLDATPERLGYVSAMTLSEATDGDLGDFLDLVDIAERHSPDATGDIHRLFRRALFSALISNTDNHLRNHGYLRTPGGWALAPAFDLNPNPDSGQLSVGVTGRTTGIVEAAVEAEEIFRHDRHDALVVLAEVVEAVDGWASVAARHGLPPAEVQRMRSAFESPEADRAAQLLRH